jgi:lipid-A-disaccharide synthase-like uncharacterized protein
VAQSLGGSPSLIEASSNLMAAALVFNCFLSCYSRKKTWKLRGFFSTAGFVFRFAVLWFGLSRFDSPGQNTP